MRQDRDRARLPFIAYLGLGRRQFRQAEIGVAASAPCEGENRKRAGADGAQRRQWRSWNRHAQLEAGAAPWPRFQRHLRIQRARAPLKTRRSRGAAVPIRPANKRRRSGSRCHCRPPTTPGLLATRSNETATRVAPACFSTLCSASRSIWITFGSHFFGELQGTLAAHERHRNAALLLKVLANPPRRSVQVGSLHIRRPHAPDECTQFLHLLLRQILQVSSRVVHARAEIAFQELAQDLQAHLQADEALQRTVMEIGSDPLALGLPRAPGLLPGLGGFARPTPPCAIPTASCRLQTHRPAYP